MIQDHDEPILKNLQDIKVKFEDMVSGDSDRCTAGAKTISSKNDVCITKRENGNECLLFLYFFSDNI